MRRARRRSNGEQARRLRVAAPRDFRRRVATLAAAHARPRRRRRSHRPRRAAAAGRPRRMAGAGPRLLADRPTGAGVLRGRRDPRGLRARAADRRRPLRRRARLRQPRRAAHRRPAGARADVDPKRPGPRDPRQALVHPAGAGRPGRDRQQRCKRPRQRDRDQADGPAVGHRHALHRRRGDAQPADDPGRRPPGRPDPRRPAGGAVPS